jgi:hypothetical protein
MTTTPCAPRCCRAAGSTLQPSLTTPQVFSALLPLSLHHSLPLSAQSGDRSHQTAVRCPAVSLLLLFTLKPASLPLFMASLQRSILYPPPSFPSVMFAAVKCAKQRLATLAI